MKITVVSDLHLEFGDLDLKNTQKADTLILSGDIVVAQDLNRSEDSPKFNRVKMMKEFIHRCTQEFSNVIAVAGNHEFYGSEYSKALNIVQDTYKEFGVHFLEKDFVKLNGITFMGGVLWTDFNKVDPMSMHAAKFGMNDYQVISYHDKAKSIYRKLTPEDTLTVHNHTKQFLINQLAATKDKVVVVGHHAPTYMSTKPRYQADHLINGAYRSDLSDLILDNPQIKLWTHGHTHDNFDYMVGTTRVVCNPRGYYMYDVNPTFNPNMVIEV